MGGEYPVGHLPLIIGDGSTARRLLDPWLSALPLNRWPTGVSTMYDLEHTTTL